ncbi:putative choline sulfatase [Paenibacillus algicola]|uniref:Putative choline sulfatase n=1 Tax=Paenibacillus algicola TaxID=2565926 RepID=A0A4P8XGN3_9BACL|nr:hypothetical protein [Paenibacillus algicola]QCT01485.1 putative choline sulfatase [Paenibacillus algicola]
MVDILPTFLQAAGIEPQEDYSGRSLLDIAEGKHLRELTMGQYNRNEFGVYMAVTERCKYIYSCIPGYERKFEVNQHDLFRTKF